MKFSLTGIKALSIIFLMLLSANNGFAQARAQADVSITSVTIVPAPSLFTRSAKIPNNPVIPNVPAEKVATPIDANLKCTITVHNENGGLAFQTKLVVLLPVETTIISNLNSSTEYRSNGNRGSLGSLLIDLSHIGVGQDRLIEFTFTRSAYGSTVGAYVFSGTPDPNPANNYKDATY